MIDPIKGKVAMIPADPVKKLFFVGINIYFLILVPMNSDNEFRDILNNQIDAAQEVIIKDNDKNTVIKQIEHKELIQNYNETKKLNVKGEHINAVNQTERNTIDYACEQTIAMEQKTNFIFEYLKKCNAQYNYHNPNPNKI